jgi:cobalamin biosynthesis protein CobD/CbiB
LGGPLSYDGRTETRPAMGSGRPPVPEDIRRACRLSLAVCAVAAAASAVVATIRRRIGGPRR